MKFCDVCEYLAPHEWEQTEVKEPHMCKAYPHGAPLKHGRYHPRIPRPPGCSQFNSMAHKLPPAVFHYWRTNGRLPTSPTHKFKEKHNGKASNTNSKN